MCETNEPQGRNTSNRPLCINSLSEHLWLHTKKSFLNLYCFHITVEMTSFSLRRVWPLHVAAHCAPAIAHAYSDKAGAKIHSCRMYYVDWNALCKVFRTVCWALCTAMLIWQVTPLPHGALHSDKPVFKKAIMIVVQIVGEGTVTIM